MNKKDYTDQYYKHLYEKLSERAYLLEKMLKKKKIEAHSKKSKKLDPVGKEDEDVDNDGKPNTKTDQYLKNRRKKIKQAMMKKKQSVEEGTIITNGELFYGGFPKLLNENKGKTEQYQDSLSDSDIDIATKTNEEEKNLYVPNSMGLRYPSAEYRDIHTLENTAGEESRRLHGELSRAKQAAYLEHMKGYYGKGNKVSAERARSFTFTPDPVTATQAKEALEKMKSFRQKREAHPHHASFMDAAKRFEDSVRGGNYGE